MTPDLSRKLAHILNLYARVPDHDSEHGQAFRRFIVTHEDDINSPEDIPADFKDILNLE